MLHKGIALVVVLYILLVQPAGGSILAQQDVAPFYVPTLGKLDSLDWRQVPSLESLSLSSLSSLVVKLPTLEVVGAQDADVPLPLASLTKLMTSLVLLDNGIQLGRELTVTNADTNRLLTKYSIAGDRISYLAVQDGEAIRVGDLLAACLVGSANNATATLARSVEPNIDRFAKIMNEYADTLGLQDAEFKEPTGLDALNTATAFEVAMIAQRAWQDDLLRQLSGSPQITFTTPMNRIHRIKNTNPLFHNAHGFSIVASKTGYLDEAGYNLALHIRLADKREYLIVLLNALTTESRSNDVNKIVQWLNS